MNFTHRCLPRCQYKRAFLLDRHIRRTQQQIVGVSAYNSCRCFHAARHNHHAFCPVRPARRACTDIVLLEHFICQRFHLRNTPVCLLFQRQLCTAAHHQKGTVFFVILQNFETFDQQRHSARPRCADYNSFFHSHPSHASLYPQIPSIHANNSSRS